MPVVYIDELDEKERYFTNLLAERENKLFKFVSREVFRIILKSRGIEHNLELLPETLNTYYIRLWLRPFEPWCETFNEMILMHMSAGLFRLEDLTASDLQSFQSTFRFRLAATEIPAMVLSMDDLSVGFLICGVLLAIATVIFIVEMLFKASIVFLRRLVVATVLWVYFLMVF